MESRSQRRKCFAGETTPFLLSSLDNNNNSKESRSQRRRCFAGETTPFLLSSLVSNNSKESGSQRRKCFAGETTPFLLHSLDHNNRRWKEIEEGIPFHLFNSLPFYLLLRQRIKTNFTKELL